MIEFKETFSWEGMMRVELVAEGLPRRMDSRDYHYSITVWPHGKALGKSRACGNGSVRYHHFASYAEAQEHAVKWAKRHIAEEKRRAALRAADPVRMRGYAAAWEA